MTDAHLKALFAQDEPPARDPAFSAAVMEAVARRRFLLDVAWLSGATLIGGLILWALWPVLHPLLAQVGGQLGPVAAAVTLAAVAVVLADGRATAPAG
ncbi:hypothetical protein [Phenylobacterium sp.]|uniref:hypothetical protein n=1 Tax=Phenylobacterium sp. TaxID=1871053 RepID=UPI0025CFB506|nr:hypothetical protein [Phenylobacterium sp.]MBX3482295.1 hypothetical protein [Phenylobacterium sp.]MCW5759990.1 hypothetical protein [Phenylobacterium sp.]